MYIRSKMWWHNMDPFSAYLDFFKTFWGVFQSQMDPHHPTPTALHPLHTHTRPHPYPHFSQGGM